MIQNKVLLILTVKDGEIVYRRKERQRMKSNYTQSLFRKNNINKLKK